MEIQQLRHLLAAVEHGNLLKAADKNFISQSGLSRSIKSLEQRLGVPLLVRGAKGVEPTEYGLSVMRRARVILNEVQRSIEEVKAIQGARIGEVTFGITQNYTAYLVPQLLRHLRRERPQLRVTVIADGFVELIDKVRVEAVDFAFGLIGPIHRSDDIEIEPLREHRSRVIAGRGHPLAAGAEASVQQLAEAEWAMLSSGSVQRGFQTFFETRGLAIPAQPVKTNSISLLRQAVRDMDLLTILPQDVVQPDIDTGHVTPIRCETPVEHTRIGLFFRRGGALTPQARYVIDRFRAVIGQGDTDPGSSLL
ncbi:LysR family transcriptional regulator [Sphingomonas sp. CGMCC 1.13654]|uniref:LysR family transcriptional regulator n=1 Tax=Sphingomonas chungangi TaxID=2683589 RepID=A0A838L8F3_9SPHN|nr:LysR family transcriptional regulator [Sphingomonas chungangi]MVW58140.1 LysR family transcriptional regulator [Sphingomonas chungangi]